MHMRQKILRKFVFTLMMTSGHLERYTEVTEDHVKFYHRMLQCSTFYAYIFNANI